jgi:hypothetical protein
MIRLLAWVAFIFLFIRIVQIVGRIISSSPRRSSGGDPLASAPPRPSAEKFDNIQDADFEDLTPHGDGKTPPPPKSS